MTFLRPSGRTVDQMRPVNFEPHFSPYAEGSCLIRFGSTHVVCTASVDERVPPFLRGTGRGWITAEYGMLPRATHTRMEHEATRGKQSGRTHEIQRLIGRSLRAVSDLSNLGERQIKVDCDVLQADGGTRTASITGAWRALSLACEQMLQKGMISSQPLRDQVAAVSCGITEAGVVLNLDYAEDSVAHTDANFVMTASGESSKFRVQLNRNLSPEQFSQMLSLAQWLHRIIFAAAERVTPAATEPNKPNSTL